MIERLRPLLDYDNILILGFGREGQSTYRVLRALFPHKQIAIYDARQVSAKDLSDVHLHCGVLESSVLAAADLVIKTPGIVLNHDQLKRIKQMTSQTELFLTLFRTQTIGITGTKGKSTTSSLLAHVLKQTSGNTFLVGNIGVPCFEILNEMNAASTVVFEMSCHQLEYTRQSPHIATFLNVFQEHLDHYGTMEAYIEAKRHILQYQQPGDVAVVHHSLKDLVKPDIQSLTVGHDKNSDVVVGENEIAISNQTMVITKDDTSLLGRHNLLNIGFVYAVCKTIFHVSDEAFKDALRQFRGLPHRLEWFATIDGVRYYDDSISTASETAIQALQSIDRVNTLILGGMDRHISYDLLADYLNDHYEGHVILMPDTSQRIHELLRKRMAESRWSMLHQVSNIREAVVLAKRLTKSGEACVLSPAAASYGFFRDFEERGEVFQRLVKENTQN